MNKKFLNLIEDKMKIFLIKAKILIKSSKTLCIHLEIQEKIKNMSELLIISDFQAMSSFIV
jgi:hypothetical protein